MIRQKMRDQVLVDFFSQQESSTQESGTLLLRKPSRPIWELIQSSVRPVSGRRLFAWSFKCPGCDTCYFYLLSSFKTLSNMSLWPGVSMSTKTS